MEARRLHRLVENDFVPLALDAEEALTSSAAALPLYQQICKRQIRLVEHDGVVHGAHLRAPIAPLG